MKTNKEIKERKKKRGARRLYMMANIFTIWLSLTPYDYVCVKLSLVDWALGRWNSREALISVLHHFGYTAGVAEGNCIGYCAEPDQLFIVSTNPDHNKLFEK